MIQVTLTNEQLLQLETVQNALPAYSREEVEQYAMRLLKQQMTKDNRAKQLLEDFTIEEESSDRAGRNNRSAF